MSTVFSSLILSGIPHSRNDIVNILKDSGPASTGLTFIWYKIYFSIKLSLLYNSKCIRF